MEPIKQIEIAVAEYVLNRDDLAEVVDAFNADLDRIRKKHAKALQEKVEAVTEAGIGLREVLERFPGLFEKPRTLVINGIKVGYQKGKGGITFSDPEKVVKLIRRHYTEEEALKLLNIKESPDKEALNKLPVTELKRLGCEVVDAEDQVVIKPVKSEVDKLVVSLLKIAADTAEEEGK